MSDDVFADWKRNRFIVSENYLTNRPGEFLIVLTELGFWADNIDHLATWCQMYNCEHQGMTVIVPNKETLSLFYLKWL